MPRIWEDNESMDPEVIAAIIAAVAAVVSAVLTVIGQNRVTKLQEHVQRVGEQERLLLSQYASVGAYCAEQYHSLREAYLLLFERKPGLNATHDDLIKVVQEADEEIMTPLRKYELYLDNMTAAKIREIHNLLTQVIDYPTPKAVQRLKDRKGFVYNLIHEARELLDPKGILQRKGIIARDETDTKRV